MVTGNGTQEMVKDDLPEVELKPNGTVVCRIVDPDGNSRPIRLRRPFLGELRTVRAALDEVNDETRAQLEELAERGRAIDEARTAEKLDGEAARTRAREDRATGLAMGREVSAAVDKLRIDWWRTVFGLLAMNGDLPDDDDHLPAWFVDPNAMGRVIDHFRTVPFGSGAVVGP